jgi:ubiquinone/menaquinone biosynthesis C-methylase UbiE
LTLSLLVWYENCKEIKISEQSKDKMHRSSGSIKADEFREWNERMLRKYDPDAFHHHSNPFVRFIEGMRVKAIFKVIDIGIEDWVIEIGCGAGNVIDKAPPGKLFGMDISSSVLRKARQRLNEKVHLFQADAEILPCKDKSFTYIICSEVLEHLLDPSAAIKEMVRILKTQGVIVLSVPNESMINRIKGILVQLGIFQWLFQSSGNYPTMSERMEDEWHLHAFELKEWLDLFRKYFKVTHLRKVPFYWLPLRYVVRLERRDSFMEMEWESKEGIGSYGIKG